jgi:hypothetical protein
MTGLYSELEAHKIIMIEPKASERVDFDELMRDYYYNIEEHQYNSMYDLQPVS